MIRTVRPPVASTGGIREAEASPGSARVLLAFAAIYVIWGSTYLAIRWAVETMPPLLMGGVRFLLAGGILYLLARLRGSGRATRAQWRAAAIAGTLMLAGGTGSVMVAEQWVPSGLAALLISSVPLWLVVLDVLIGSRRRPPPRVVTGLVMGMAGMLLLLGEPGAGGGGRQELLGVLLILGGSMSWAAGSLYSRHAPLPPPPMLWISMQMTAGGAALLLLAILNGDPAAVDIGGISMRSWLSVGYLVVFGALIAYSAYVWLLSVSTPARVGTYAFVNPVVAIGLGWIFAGEPITGRSAGAAATILVAVLLLTIGGPAGEAPGRDVTRWPRGRRRGTVELPPPVPVSGPDVNVPPSERS